MGSPTENDDLTWIFDAMAQARLRLDEAATAAERLPQETTHDVINFLGLAHEIADALPPEFMARKDRDILRTIEELLLERGWQVQISTDQRPDVRHYIFDFWHHECGRLISLVDSGLLPPPDPIAFPGAIEGIRNHVNTWSE